MRSLILPLLLVASTAVSAFRVSISSEDNERQVCSGMFAGPRKGGKEGEKARIEVSFEGQSAGQIALVIYEWSDVQYLGAVTPSVNPNIEEDDYLPKTYICTTSAVRSKLCDASKLGEFIVVLPTSADGGKLLTLNDTSIFTTGLRFRDGGISSPPGLSARDGNDDDRSAEEEKAALDELKADAQDDDVGLAAVTAIRHGKGAAPAKTTADAAAPTTTEPVFSIATGLPAKAETPPGTTSAQADQVDGQQQESTSTPWYDGGVISYELKKTGYYCVGTVPVTLLTSKRELAVVEERAPAPVHAEYTGEVAFLNIFQGELPAGDYPKINFYLFLTGVYFLIAAGWGALCWKYRSDLLPIQNYVSVTLVYLFVEMFVSYVFQRFQNHNGYGGKSTAFLLVVAILNAGRNSLSFFLLLVVSMGLSVVTPSLGSIMRRIQLLAVAHFIFGVIYSIGTVEISLETASLLLILSLIVGLSFTLTSFLMWTVISLNGTILHLSKRKQKHKLQMFQRLYRILMAAVVAIAAFFVVSTISLSDRTSEDYAPSNWKIRWFLLDGSLSLIYLAVFVSIAYLWRPTGNNMRLAMSEELAQDEDEADAEDFELSRVRRGGEDEEEGGVGGGRPDHPDEDEEDEVKRGRREGGRRGEGGVEDGRVVFAIDDEEEDEEEDGRKGGPREREVNEEEEAGEGERLVGGRKKDD